MSTELCACSKLEWKEEHQTLLHHPDCESAKTLAARSPNPVLAQSWGQGGFFESAAVRPKTEETPQPYSAPGPLSNYVLMCNGKPTGRRIKWETKPGGRLYFEDGEAVVYSGVEPWLNKGGGIVGVVRYGDRFDASSGKATLIALGTDYLIHRADGQTVLYDNRLKRFSPPEQLGAHLRGRQCVCGFHANQSACDEVSRAANLLAALPDPMPWFRSILSERRYRMPDPAKDECLVSGDTLRALELAELRADALETENRQLKERWGLVDDGDRILALAEQAEQIAGENLRLKEQVRELEGRIANALL